MPESMPAVFDYMNYREFLKDYYLSRKKSTPSFSYLLFARKVGFGSKSFLPHVIEGKRDLTQDSIFQIGHGLALDPKSLAYFEDLVAFNQAKDPNQKAHFFMRLTSHKKAAKARHILRTELKFFSDWYHSTVWELVTIFDFKGDYAALGKAVQPRISAGQAEESVALLLELGLIQKEKNLYVQADRKLTTGDEVRSQTVQKFHSQNLRLAQIALDKIEPSERDISCMIAGLSQTGFEMVKKKIQIFRKELTDIMAQDVEAENVYHINFQFFPTTNLKGRSA
jgi:uncharacterized protein (TIGR02147 family)